MPYTFAQSQALFTRAQRSIAAGVNSGIRKMEAPVPLYFARGSGPHLRDGARGDRRYRRTCRGTIGHPRA